MSILAILLLTFLSRSSDGQSCTPDNSNVASMQSCRNCLWASDCPGAAATFTSKSYGSWVKNRCENVVSVCGESEWDMTSNVGYMQYHATCVRYTVDSGYYSYRETCHTDCPTFIVHEYENSRGTCPTSNSIPVSEEGECLGLCLDTIGCRGATEEGSWCNLHTCGTHTSQPGETFYKRTCVEDCDSFTIQTCLNCETDYTNCPNPHYIVTETLADCSASCLASTDCQTATYISTGVCVHYDCNLLILATMNTVLKRVCHTDCPEYTLERLDGETGDCVLDLDDYKSMTESECLANCLEMPGCRGVSFISSLHKCVYNNCTTSVADNDSVFIARHCIVPTYTQVCKNCAPSTGCSSALTAIATTDDNVRSGNCNTTCSGDNDCLMAFFDPSIDRCTYHTCTDITQANYSTEVYRTTENPDCLEYEIFVINNYRASCSHKLSETNGVSDISVCISACADMEGCVGITYHHQSTKCDYFNCTDMYYDEDHTFIKKVCTTGTPCSKDFVQTCLNCDVGQYCQGYTDLFSNQPTIKDCISKLTSDETTNIFVYDKLHGSCEMSECSKIRQQPNTTMVAARKTCNSVCTTFRLFTVDGHEGACAEFETDLGSVSEDYCIERCLDMANCLGVSYNENEAWCKYHSCLESQPNATFTFIRRECVDVTEVKQFIQTCWNCDTTCTMPVDTQISVLSASNCTVNGNEAAIAKFDPSTDQCNSYECDVTTIPDVGAVVKRKASNDDCQEYELFGYSNKVPNCTHGQQTTGVRNVEYCVNTCLDLPGCRATLFNSTVCQYYNCSTLIDATDPGVMVMRHCRNGCSTNLQTCFNCGIGPECPSAIESQTMTETNCENRCDSLSTCEAVEYVNSSSQCSLYGCGEVSRTYQSKVYRKSCGNGCPLYEVYQWLGQESKWCTTWTENFITKPYLCLERCLNKPNCRAVSYKPYQCSYHTCDCSEPGDGNALFMWRYCLDSAANVTVLPNGNSTLPANFPKADNCSETPSTVTTTSSTVTTTSSTIPITSRTASSTQTTSFTIISTPPIIQFTTSSAVTPSLTNTPTVPTASSSVTLPWTSPVSSSLIPTTNSGLQGQVVPVAIYLTPCFCSSGQNNNKTNAEIIAEIVESLTINTKNISSTRRKLTCAVDDRTSSQLMGAAGSIWLAVSAVVLTGSDIVAVLKTLIHLFKSGSALNS